MVVFTSQARALDGDVLTVTFPNQTDVDNFKQPQGAGEGVSEYLRKAIIEVLGIRVKFIARVEPSLADAATPEPTASVSGPSTNSGTEGSVDETVADASLPAASPSAGAQGTATTTVDDAGWAVAEIPTSAPEPSSAPAARPAKAPASSAPAASANASSPEPMRYGESVVREILGASFIEEHSVAPSVTPREN